MKRRYWLLFIAATVAVAVLAVPTAEAACGALVRFNSGNYPNQAYIQPAGWPASGTSSDPGGNGGTHLGTFWQPGRRGAQWNNTYDHSQWWVRFAAAYGWYFEANMTNPGVAGCPGAPASFGGDESAPGELITCALELGAADANGNGDALYYCSRQRFEISAGVQYQQGPANSAETWSAQDMVPIPRPEINGAIVRAGTDHTVELCWDDVDLGFQRGANDVPDAYTTINAYNICTAEAAAHPDRAAGSWACGAGNATDTASVASANGGSCATVTLSCSSGEGNANDLYVATQLSVDGGDSASGYDTEYVSRAIVIECDPTLADPQPTRQRGVREVPTRRSR